MGGIRGRLEGVRGGGREWAGGSWWNTNPEPGGMGVGAIGHVAYSA